jgi:hypothetical protein
MNAVDVAEIVRAGRRCSVCRSGRHWRQLELVRLPGREPIVLCAACRARHPDGDGLETIQIPASVLAPPRSPAQANSPAQARSQAPPRPPAPNSHGSQDPSTRRATPTSQAASPAEAQPSPQAPSPSESQAQARERQAEHEDRLKRALRELPRGEHSTGRIAKAAGLNHSKTLGRLHKLKAAGEVHQVGKLWTIDPPANGLEAAFDRLQAQTSNLRIIRERPPSD